MTAASNMTQHYAAQHLLNHSQHQQQNQHQHQQQRPATGTPTHPLRCSFTVWILNRNTALSSEDYEQSLRRYASFSTVEDFFRVYSHLQRPSALRGSNVVYHVFRDGITPLWEHPDNVRGGKYILRVKKSAIDATEHAQPQGTAVDFIDRCWEDLLLAFVGGSPMLEDVNGIVLTCKLADNQLSVWTRSALDTRLTARVKNGVKHALQMSNSTANAALEYRPHDVALSKLHK